MIFGPQNVPGNVLSKDVTVADINIRIPFSAILFISVSLKWFSHKDTDKR